MDKNDTAEGKISETELMSLLASLKVEPAPEADFEGRFIYDLRERLARESVCCSARRLLWDHIVQFFSGYASHKLAYGASALGLVAVGLGFYALQGTPGAPGVVVSEASTHFSLSHLEKGLSGLRPGSAEGTQACTTIRVCADKQEPYTQLSLASKGFAPSFAPGASSEQRSNPVNMGLYSQGGAFVPDFTTKPGF